MRQLIYMFVLITVLSCRGDFVEEPPYTTTPDKASPIIFTQSDVLTRGDNPMDVNKIGIGYGIFAASTGEQTGVTNEKLDYISNEKVYYDHNHFAWLSATHLYWPLKGNLSFFAYAPYAGSYDHNGIIAPAPSYKDGMLQIEYTPNSQDIIYQVDFSVAKPLHGKDKNVGTVSFEFNHTLTQVWFKANYQGTLPNNKYYVKVDNIALKGVKGSKVLTYTNTSPYYNWESDVKATDIANYQLERRKVQSHLVDTKLPFRDEENSNHVLLNDTLGYLYLLPQTLGNGAHIEVTYSLCHLVGSTENIITQLSKNIDLPSSPEWIPNKSVTYIFTISIDDLSIIDITGQNDGWITDYQDGGTTNGGDIE